MTTRIKRKGLPRGISWLESRQRYMGRFMYQGKSHVIYDADYDRIVSRLNQLKLEVMGGKQEEANNDNDTTFDDWFHEWMGIKTKSMRENTCRSYTSYYNKHLSKELGKMKLTDIRAKDIEEVIYKMRDKGLAGTTVLGVVKMMRTCFKKAYKRELIKKNPMELVDLDMRIRKKERYVMTREQQELLLKYAEQSKIGDMIMVLAMTGMRCGECRALQWQDIDFDKETIHVRHSIIRLAEGKYKLTDGKTETSNRKIPMLPLVYNILEERYKMGKHNEDDFVFSEGGKPLGEDKVNKALANIERHILEDGHDIGHVTAHTLRHSFATRAIENGMNPQVLKRILGHANYSITMDLYSHVMPDETAKGIALLEDYFYNA